MAAAGARGGKGSRGQIRSSDVTMRGSAQTVPIPAGYGYGACRRRWWVAAAAGGHRRRRDRRVPEPAGLRRPAAGHAVRRQRPADRRAQDASHHVAYPGPPVPAKFTAALTATEDHRFGSEPGIDPFAVVRAAAGASCGQRNPGGATIYQQLAKMLYTPGESGVSVEAKQVALAVKLRYSYSGSQILQMYGDVAYFGNGYYGIQRGELRLLRRHAGRDVLAAGRDAGRGGQRPVARRPGDQPGNGRAREEHVIGRLVATGALTQAQADRALAVPVSAMLAHAGQGCGA